LPSRAWFACNAFSFLVGHRDWVNDGWQHAFSAIADEIFRTTWDNWELSAVEVNVTPSAYLFLELAIISFFVGFGWEHWDLKELRAPVFWLPALALAGIWFAIDQIAIQLGLWTFPQTGTFPIRLFSLPLEEYVLFFLHTLLCFILLKCYSGAEK